MGASELKYILIFCDNDFYFLRNAKCFFFIMFLSLFYYYNISNNCPILGPTIDSKKSIPTFICSYQLSYQDVEKTAPSPVLKTRSTIDLLAHNNKKCMKRTANTLTHLWISRPLPGGADAVTPQTRSSTADRDADPPPLPKVRVRSYLVPGC